MAEEQHRTTARILDIFEQVSISEEGLTLTALGQRLSAHLRAAFFLSYIRWKNGAI